MAPVKLSILCSILIFHGLFFTDSYAQCSLKIDYKIESKSKGSSTVNIKSREGSGEVKIQLYDLNTGQVASEKVIHISNSFKSIFTDVKASLYILYIWMPGCTKPVVVEGERHGILIEN